jgi:hypothetical protein
MNIQVKYTPANANPWSQSPDKTIKVGSGTTPLNWSIQVIPASAGTIAFNTASTSPGIQFTGTGNSSWPGALPTADGDDYQSSITNTLPAGANSVSFHYRVNAVYTPTGGSPVNVTWDPDVQEDPPPQIVIG